MGIVDSPCLQRPDVSWRGSYDFIAIIQKYTTDQIKPLLRTAGQQNVVGGDLNARFSAQCSNLIPQVGITLCRAILKGGAALLSENFIGGDSCGFQRKGFRRRQ